MENLIILAVIAIIIGLAVGYIHMSHWQKMQPNRKKTLAILKAFVAMAACAHCMTTAAKMKLMH